MLQEKTQNPHATLLTLYMNAVEEVLRYFEDRDTSTKNRKAAMVRASRFFQKDGRVASVHSPQVMQMTAATDSFMDFDLYFDKWVSIYPLPLGNLLMTSPGT